jgi:hypothetical protein
LRRKNDVLQPLSLVIEKHIEDFVILTIIVGGYHAHVLAISVLVSRLLEFLLFSREMANDLVGGHALGRGGVEGSFLGPGGRQ